MEDQPQPNPSKLDSDQVRKRLKEAVAFRQSEAYLDFVANQEEVISTADVAIEQPPENYYLDKVREQAIGERRQARISKDFFLDYIEDMHIRLNLLLAEQELEPEDHRNPNTNENGN